MVFPSRSQSPWTGTGNDLTKSGLEGPVSDHNIRDVAVEEAVH